MLVLGDLKALEWCTCAYLSQDKVAIAELQNPDADMHTDNKDRFGLPDRLIAKKFLFRLIFGGTAPAYCYDPEFNFISDKTKFWQGVIDEFYTKYPEIREWHARLVLEAMEHGRVTIPTGRFFCYQPYKKNNGEWIWPRTRILNYPVQGLGADIMMIGRVLMYKELKRLGMMAKIICTVHDSLLIDCPDEEVQEVIKLFYKVCRNIPRVFERKFGVPYNVPCRVEVQYGPNWGNMEKHNNAN